VRDEFDSVIIDGASMLDCWESQQLVASADSVIIVVRTHSTRDRELAETLSLLMRARASIMGLVMNGVRRLDRVAYRLHAPAYTNSPRL
jgi:Mrp family chromosome partitioning ATPase